MPKKTSYCDPIMQPVVADDSVLNFAKTTPAKNFNARTSSRKFNYVYDTDNTDASKAQEQDVYTYAKKVADTHGISEIIDIGCGAVDTLNDVFDVKRYSIQGIGNSTQVMEAKKLYPEENWRSGNLSDGYVVDKMFHYFQSTTPKLFMVYGTIETMIDPRLLLRKIRQILKLNPDSTLIIATPDAEKGQTYDQKTKLPKDQRHVREWDLQGLVGFLQSSGFTVTTQGHVRSSSSDENFCTCLVSVKADENSHRKVLQSMRLPQPSKVMIITTEHADTKVTGGIGSYVKEVEEVASRVHPIVLFCGAPALRESLVVSRPDNLIDVRSVVNWFYVMNKTDYSSSSTSIYEAVRNLVYLYDQIETVEYQEYRGVGARLSQGKQVGALPGCVTLMARCHGSQMYIDRSTQSWTGKKKGEAFELERMSVRYADVVSSPTEYLRDLYLSTGYDFNGETIIQRLPYRYKNVPFPEYSEIDTLVFLGKRSEMKGYDDFCHLALTVTNPEDKDFISNIKNVVVIARASVDFESLDQKMMKVLEQRGVTVSMQELERAQVLVAIKELAGHSLMILPYGGDNHPVTVLEAIESHIDFAAYDKGGIPELIPEDMKDDFLCYGDKSKLIEFVTKKVNVSVKERTKKLKEVYRQAEKQQTVINQQVIKTYEDGWSGRQEPRTSANGEDATVLVPCYGTDLEYVEALIDCLNQQSMYPHEVIFINDATPDETYGSRLESLITDKLHIPWRLITHEVNKGLAAARNTALENCQTKYLINVDSDDLIANDFIYDYVSFMSNNPSYAAAICALESFTDKDQKNVYDASHAKYRYLGVGDCLVLGLEKNVFGHSGSCVLVSAARDIGGWDASDRSMWEDWAFYLKLTSAGGKIFNFPKINYYYRISDSSMARTYAKYPAQLRLVRNIAGLNIWESERLYAVINDDGYRKSNEVTTHAPEESRADRIINKVRPATHRARQLKNTVHRILRNK